PKPVHLPALLIEIGLIPVKRTFGELHAVKIARAFEGMQHPQNIIPIHRSITPVLSREASAAVCRHPAPWFHSGAYPCPIPDRRRSVAARCQRRGDPRPAASSP